jgi:hypothetical protein
VAGHALPHLGELAEQTAETHGSGRAHRRMWGGS